MFKRVLCILTLLILAFANALFGADSGTRYAVETRNGTPFITIDGRPVRSRFFFGLMGSAPTIVSREWTSHSYEFVAKDDAQGDGTMHFRFGRTPGRVEIDNVSIVEKETGRVVFGVCGFESPEEYSDNWTVFHDKFQDKEIASVSVDSGKLVVQLNEFPEDWRPDFHLYTNPKLTFHKGSTYVAKFDLRADATRAINVAVYRPASPSYIRIGTVGKDVFANQVKLASEAGVDFVSFEPVVPVWPDADGNYDWKQLDALCDDALEANPNAKLVPRLRVNATKEWLDAHPSARAVWREAKGDWDGQGWEWASPSSPEYRRVACEGLAAAVRHLEAKYGDAVAGYHPAGQNTSEWFAPNTWADGYAGFSESDRDAFRRWLREKYATNERLQESWNARDVTFETAEVPSVEERDASRQKAFIDSQKLLDFNEFWQTTFTGAILDLAKTIKQETNGRKLSFFFYGYSYEFASVKKGPAASGHYALRQLLDSPDVDIICSPISYSERQLGGGCSCMLNAESVQAAGKLYLYEDDSRTYLAYELGADLAPTTNLKDSTSVLVRNSAECAIRNFATWLMDLGATGWYDSPELWSASASLERLDRYFLENPTPYAPEVGVFLSERSVLKFSDGRFSSGISRFRRSLNLLSAPYAQYDLDDLLSGRVAAPKLTIILNNEALDNATRARVEEQARKSSARVLYLDAEGCDTHKLRSEAGLAGVWIYTDRWCNVWANGPYVLLHAPCDETYELKVPNGKTKIYDYFTNELLSENGRVSLELKLGDTRIIRYE